MKFPGSVLVSVVLFVAETAAALCLSGAYRAAGDRMWQWLTLLFALLPCALVQLSLVFIHRDVSRDRPLVLLLHLLQLGPLVRSVRDPPVLLGGCGEPRGAEGGGACEPRGGTERRVAGGERRRPCPGAGGRSFVALQSPTVRVLLLSFLLAFFFSWCFLRVASARVALRR